MLNQIWETVKYLSSKVSCVIWVQLHVCSPGRLPIADMCWNPATRAQ